MEPGTVFAFALLFASVVYGVVLYVIVFIDYHPNWRFLVYKKISNVWSTIEEQDESDFNDEEDKKIN